MSDDEKLRELKRENAALRAEIERQEAIIRQLAEELGYGITQADLDSAVPGQPWMAKFLHDLEGGEADTPVRVS